MRNESSTKLNARLLRADAVDLTLVKIWSDNDDTGRHGVLIPVDAYGILGPWRAPFEQPAANHTRSVQVEIRDLGRAARRSIAEKYYARYPERRLTRLALGAGFRPEHRACIFSRRKDTQGLLEIHPLSLTSRADRLLLDEVGLGQGLPGSWVLVRD